MSVCVSVCVSDHSVSHSFLKNTALSEDIVIFTVKARLQVLPTRLNLSIWFPTTQVPHCLHHTTEQITETLPHILNGCNAYKGMYIARHDRIVDLIVKDISNNEECREVFVLEIACTFDSSMEEAFMTSH